MNAFIALSDNRRRLICEQGQSRLGLPAASLEKDFWVCWILKQLFELEKRASRIAAYRSGSVVDDDKTLDEIRSWGIERLLKFKSVFSPHLKAYKS